MAKKFKRRLLSILERGYLPAELPPPFTARSYAHKLVADPLGQLHTQLRKPTRSRSETHRIPRPNGGRRRLSIPNPISYFALAYQISSHWKAISEHLKQSEVSAGRPIWNPNRGRSIISSKRHADLAKYRIRLRSRARYVVRTDISQFYNSIYTHSIPWAFHGKSFAKRNRGLAHLGNRLDKCIQLLQDGQTSGIPIGPDCSLVVAESILIGADSALVRAIPELNGFRHVDDYEVGCSTYSDAEFVVSSIQRSLDRFELEINPLKTSITRLPIPLEPDWVSQLRSFQFRDRPSSQRQDVIDYFDCAFGWVDKGVGRSVLIYALIKLSTAEISEENWPTTQQLILQALRNDPSIAYSALSAILNQYARIQKIDHDLVGETLNSIVQESVVAGHSNEVAWALWGLMRLNLKVTAATAKALSKMDDSIVALLSLDADQRNLIEGSLNTDNWKGYCNLNELTGEKWLLAYESNVKGWLPSSTDFVSQHPTFKLFKAAGISFYESSLVSNVRLTGTSRTAGIHPMFSV